MLTGGWYLHRSLDWSPVGANKSKPKSWAGLQFISSHRRPAAEGTVQQSAVCLHRWEKIEMVTCRSNEVEAPFGASTSLLPQATSRGALAAINRWEEIERPPVGATKLNPQPSPSSQFLARIRFHPTSPQSWKSNQVHILQVTTFNLPSWPFYLHQPPLLRICEPSALFLSPPPRLGDFAEDLVQQLAHQVLGLCLCLHLRVLG